MDILTNKSYKTYESLSRFSSFPTYYNTVDDKYMYGILSQLDTSTQYVLHNITSEDTLELLSLTYYGRPDYYWVIALFNNINDVFIKLYNNYETIKIPNISNIKFK